MNITAMAGPAISRCLRFLRLFGVSVLSDIGSTPDRVHALVAWPDSCTAGVPNPEEVQEIVWTTMSDEDLDDALTLGELAYDAGGIRSDRLILSHEDASKMTGWGSEKLSRCFGILLSIRVYRVDDGKEGDAFLLHK